MSFLASQELYKFVGSPVLALELELVPPSTHKYYKRTCADDMEIETPIRTSLTANFAKYFCRVKINVIWLNWSWQSLDELGARVNNMLFDNNNHAGP